jgi:hypothetical protein
MVSSVHAATIVSMRNRCYSIVDRYCYLTNLTWGSIELPPLAVDSTSIEILKGRAQILERARALEELALRCCQRGGMHNLDYFLTLQSARSRIPVLLLGFTSEKGLDWAVLVYELAPFGIHTGIFSTEEISGYRTVIAPEQTRATAASAAAAALLAQDAHAVVITCLSPYDNAGFALSPTVPNCQWTLRARTVARTLKVHHGSYEATLKSLGKSTRFNMGYYRRKLARQLNTQFISDARGIFTDAEFLTLNEGSLNPVTPELASLQYKMACTVRGGFLLGLCAEDGQWLGLIGGWRQAETTVLLWQLNRAGFERNSLGIVMRGYFLEHEITRGAQEVTFHGGSPNSIEHSFVKEDVTDLIVLRDTWRSATLIALARFFGRSHWWKKVPSFSAASISDPDLHWRSQVKQSD